MVARRIGCGATALPVRRSVSAECLPTFEAPNTTPDVRSTSGEPLVASMYLLAGLDPNDTGVDQLAAIVAEYEAWIARQSLRFGELSERQRATAKAHLDQCTEAANRMAMAFRYCRAIHKSAAHSSSRILRCSCNSYGQDVKRARLIRPGSRNPLICRAL